MEWITSQVKTLLIFGISILIMINLASAELISSPDYQVISSLTRGSELMTSADYQVYASIIEIAGITNDTDYKVCVGITCQMFTPTITLPPRGGGGGAGGGGGNITPPQQNLTTEELNQLLKQCYDTGGTPVNIKGGLFCKKGDVYTELKIEEDIDFFGIKIINLGRIINPKNATIGWIVIALISSAILMMLAEKREKDKQIRKARRIAVDNPELADELSRVRRTDSTTGKRIIRDLNQRR
jgi:hypothetical protein